MGEGGFGSVYKGSLPDGREIAVKQLKIGGGQGEKEFKAEVEIISRIHHRHLVSLVGFCIQDTRRLLVYDYVSNDTLYFHLHGKTTSEWQKIVSLLVFLLPLIVVTEIVICRAGSACARLGKTC